MPQMNILINSGVDGELKMKPSKDRTDTMLALKYYADWEGVSVTMTRDADGGRDSGFLTLAEWNQLCKKSQWISQILKDITPIPKQKSEVPQKDCIQFFGWKTDCAQAENKCDYTSRTEAVVEGEAEHARICEIKPGLIPCNLDIVEKMTLNIPTTVGLLFSIIQWLTVQELFEIKGACPGCEINAPGQRSHMGLSGCLTDIDKTNSFFGKDISIDSTLLHGMYAEMRPKLGLPADPDAVITSKFALETYQYCGEELRKRDISLDFLFENYTREQEK